MTLARHYRLTPKAGADAELRQALGALKAALGAVPGFEGADVLRAPEPPHTMVFIEKWASPEAYKAGGGSVPKPVLSQIMATLDGPPETATYEYLT
jgi:quinol monooxygenase YgiN